MRVTGGEKVWEGCSNVDLSKAEEGVRPEEPPRVKAERWFFAIGRTLQAVAVASRRSPRETNICVGIEI